MTMKSHSHLLKCDVSGVERMSLMMIHAGRRLEGVVPHFGPAVMRMSSIAEAIIIIFRSYTLFTVASSGKECV